MKISAAISGNPIPYNSMISFSNFTERFRRVTNGGKYMPEIDGLRFIAIALVVLLIHMGTYIHSYVMQLKTSGYLYRFCFLGANGVSVFFIISGFILSLPFARQHLLGSQPVSLKNYFVRRVTRIEPAYIISLIIYFILRVWVMRYESFTELLPHFWASFFYVHNIVYNNFSIVNAVTWSLEVEIQFYLLAPFLSRIYCIKNTVLRRMIFISFIIMGTMISFQLQYHMASIIDKGCYFITGMLLADLYLLNKKSFDSPAFTIAGAGCFVASLFTPAYYVNVWFCMLWLLFTGIYFFFVITNATLKKWLSYKPVAIIGGMCYSIYLVHQGILGFLRHRFARINFVDNNILNAIIHYILAIIIILIISGLFFLLIEKPTMKRDWHKNVFKKIHI